MTSTEADKSTRSSPLISNSPSNISPLFSESLHGWDSQLSLRIHKWGLKIPRFVLQVLEYTGDGLFWIPATVALCWAPPFTLQPFFKSLLIGFIFDLLVIGTIKALFRRPRPVYNKGMYLVLSVDHYSFPSGHSSRAFLILMFVFYYASDWRETVFQAASRFFIEDMGMSSSLELLGYYIFPFIAAFWASATASSRIFLGRHFVLDVMVGSLLGILEALFAIRFLIQLQFFLDDKQRWLLEYVQQLKEALFRLA